VQERAILVAAGTRAFVIGFCGIFIGLYLARLGLPPTRVGIIIGLGFAGTATGTGLVTLYGDRLDRRSALAATTLLSAMGLGILATSGDAGLLSAVAFLGMANGMGRDRGPAQALELGFLADRTTGEARTALFTRYTAAQDICGGLGSLAAVLPDLPGISDRLAAYRASLWTAAALSLLPLLAYAVLPAEKAPTLADGTAFVSRDTRRRVLSLSALFGLDSLGGGFLAGSVLAYWFFRRFGWAGERLGPLFFAAKTLNVASYFGSEFLARRIGLIRTMVYTHLPSSLLLLVLPFTTNAVVAMTAFLMREALVQMDVPARQAYVATVTSPGERTFAMGATSVTRNLGWAVGPGLAGASIAAFGLAAPLLIGAGLKMVYDLALYRSFRDVGEPA